MARRKTSTRSTAPAESGSSRGKQGEKDRSTVEAPPLPTPPPIDERLVRMFLDEIEEACGRARDEIINSRMLNADESEHIRDGLAYLNSARYSIEDLRGRLPSTKGEVQS